jgi:hypothetical protein
VAGNRVFDLNVRNSVAQMGGKGHVATVGNYRQTIVGELPATHLKTIWPKGSNTSALFVLSDYRQSWSAPRLHSNV